MELTRDRLRELANEHGARVQGTKRDLATNIAHRLHDAKWTATVTISEP